MPDNSYITNGAPSYSPINAEPSQDIAGRMQANLNSLYNPKLDATTARMLRSCIQADYQTLRDQNYFISSSAGTTLGHNVRAAGVVHDGSQGLPAIMSSTPSPQPSTMPYQAPSLSSLSMDAAGTSATTGQNVSGIGGTYNPITNSYQQSRSTLAQGMSTATPAQPQTKQPTAQPPLLNDDMNYFKQWSPVRQFIPTTSSRIGISSATFVNPHSGRISTYFYGGAGDPNMFGRRLSADTDPRVKAAIASSPLFQSGYLPPSVASVGTVRHASYDPTTGTYRYEFTNGQVVNYDRNFYPVNSQALNFHASGADKKNTLNFGDYFAASLGDDINAGQQGLRNLSNWLGNKVEAGMNDYYSTMESGPVLRGGPRVQPSAGDKLVSKFIGNIPRSAGNLVANTPDSAGAILNTVATGAKTDIDGVLQLGARTFGNTGAANQWNQTRLNDLHDLDGQVKNLISGATGGPDGPMVQTIAGVMALGRKNPKLASQFFNDAISKEGQNIFNDPAQAYLTLEGIGGGFKSFNMATAKANTALVDRFAGTLDRVAADADAKGQAAAASAARAKAAQLRQAKGHLNSLIQMAQSRGVVASTTEAIANPERQSFGDTSATPNKPTQIVQKPPPTTPQLGSSYSGAPAKVGAPDIWSVNDPFGHKELGSAPREFNPYNYEYGGHGPATLLTKQAPVSWRNGLGIDKDLGAASEDAPQDTPNSGTKWTRAETPEQTEEYAASLGTKADYLGSLSFGNKINEQLAKLHELGVPLPPSVPIGNVSDDGHVAEYDPNNGGIIINPNHDYWSNPLGVSLRQGIGKLWSTASSLHLMTHEVAHWLHDLTSRDVYRQLSKVNLTDDQRNMIATEVSDRAAVDPHEFVAEVYTGLVHNKKYPEGIMKLYSEFGGPKHD